MIVRESMSHPDDGAGGRRSARAVAKGNGPAKPRHLRTSARSGLRVDRLPLADLMPSGGDPRCPIGRPTPREGDHLTLSSRLVNGSETGPCLTLEQENRATFHAARGNDPANPRSARTFSCREGIGRIAISSLCSKAKPIGARPISSILKIRLRWPTRVRPVWLDLNSDEDDAVGEGDEIANVPKTCRPLSLPSRKRTPISTIS